MFTYKTRGVCARTIELDIDEKGIIRNVIFEGGCRGNTQGVAQLAIGKNAREVARLLKGIQCRGNTSCPDQLAKALKQYKESLS